jgi:hypothetical protein
MAFVFGNPMNFLQSNQRANNDSVATLFELPTLVTADGKDAVDAWKEYEQLARRKIDVSSAQQLISSRGLTPEVMSVSGIERLDNVVYDPTAITVGIWADRQGVLRGATRIRFTN